MLFVHKVWFLFFHVIDQLVRQEGIQCSSRICWGGEECSRSLWFQPAWQQSTSPPPQDCFFFLSFKSCFLFTSLTLFFLPVMLLLCFFLLIDRSRSNKESHHPLTLDPGCQRCHHHLSCQWLIDTAKLTHYISSDWFVAGKKTYLFLLCHVVRSAWYNYYGIVKP